MFSAILILLAMPFTDLSRSRGIQFRPLSKIAFYIFIGNFLILMQLGAKHVESPFIEFGQISTVLYFAHFLAIVPFLSLLENSLIELPESSQETVEFNTLSTPLTSDISSIFLLTATTGTISIESVLTEAGNLILPIISYLTCDVICD
jgi:ubiquinol-cytochrome c reductase cytochrome b subunit